MKTRARICFSVESCAKLDNSNSLAFRLRRRRTILHKAQCSLQFEAQVTLTGPIVGSLNLDSFVEAVSRIYARLDHRRSVWDVWSHAMHHAAAIAEEIRKHPDAVGGDVKLRQEIADFSLWLFSMLGKLNGQVGLAREGEASQDSLIRVSSGPSRLMWQRYPGICPWCYCLTSNCLSKSIVVPDGIRVCECDELGAAARPKIREQLRQRAMAIRRIALGVAARSPESIDQWQNLIRALYGKRLLRLSLAEVALHLLEEMGEVSDGLVRMYTYLEGTATHNEFRARQIRLEDELADVLSWLFAIIEKLNLKLYEQSQRDSGRLLLSQIVWAQYGSDDNGSFWCRHCRHAQCECPVVFLQDATSISPMASQFGE